MKPRWRATTLVVLLAEVALVAWIRLIQPQCEPCPPDYDCPPCISTEQYVLLFAMIALPPIAFVLHALLARRAPFGQFFTKRT